MNGKEWQIEVLKRVSRAIRQLSEECRQEVLDVLEALEEYGPEFPGSLDCATS